jgi:RNA polymerase sigma-70 factor, ECF subfamily
MGRDITATGGVHVSQTTPAGRDFETFYGDEHTDLYAALWLVTRNRHEAEEIMQDAFLKLWERWGRVGELDDPTGYLYRTAMNVFRNRSRRAGVALRKTLRLLPPDDALARVEDREVIVRALAPLTKRQRAAVVLTSILGYTSDEAAEILGIRSSTVRVLAGRGRAELRRTMGETDE